MRVVARCHRTGRGACIHSGHRTDAEIRSCSSRIRRSGAAIDYSHRATHIRGRASEISRDRSSRKIAEPISSHHFACGISSGAKARPGWRSRAICSQELPRRTSRKHLSRATRRLIRHRPSATARQVGSIRGCCGECLPARRSGRSIRGQHRVSRADAYFVHLASGIAMKYLPRPRRVVTGRGHAVRLSVQIRMRVVALRYRSGRCPCVERRRIT